ncbi:hypothetical protein SDC9_117990 [bioreactor metagenome]|uniref:Uncharacterized protein n=1 Tax=bioreactor metagenome TaxID=1076179 RepID=A0A645C125_9ZZZZ
MIISEIIINELREIGSIKININDNFVTYLNREEGVSIEGTPSSFMSRNIGINVLKLNIKIKKNYSNFGTIWYSPMYI